MNQLPLATRVQIINLLVEGNSLRATARITGASKVTILRLLENVGRACQNFHNEKVMGVAAKKIQCDEIWSFCYAKEKNVPEEMKGTGEAGDVWTWTALDSDSKLIVSWFVGDRTVETASLFMQDVAGRLSNRVQLTTDGYKPYLNAVEDAFGNDIDYAQLVKIYGGSEGNSNERKYSPEKFNGSKKSRVVGNPDPKAVSTSHVERQNLTMRMHMRRFTRLTNAFSKKMENHCFAIALHFVYYNFCKIHQTLRVTPAMEAGLTKDIMSIEEIVLLTDKK